MAKLRITQEKSGLSQNKRQRATLSALGLGKPHKTVVKEATPQIRGMISKVAHLLSVEQLD